MRASNLLVTPAGRFRQPDPMQTLTGFRRVARLMTLGLLFVALPLSAFAQAATGTITGRILNEATGQYLRSATVTVVGTNISTVAEAGGVYTLNGVPAGPARLSIAYAGLDPAEVSVNV